MDTTASMMLQMLGTRILSTAIELNRHAEGRNLLYLNKKRRCKRMWLTKSECSYVPYDNTSGWSAVHSFEDQAKHMDDITLALTELVESGLMETDDNVKYTVTIKGFKLGTQLLRLAQV